MALSLETSTSSLLLFLLAIPVQELVNLISQHQVCKHRRDGKAEPPQTPPPALHRQDTPYTPVRRAVNALTSTSASFLVSQSPIKSTSQLPTFQTIMILRNVHRDKALLAEGPSTEREKLLMAVLGQLEGQEQKKRKTAQTGQLPVPKDGKAKVRKMDIKERKEAIQRAWKQDVKWWDIEWDSAKFDCQKPQVDKAKDAPSGEVFLKPTVSNFGDGSEDEGDMDNMNKDENDDGEISDGNDSG
ncbi:hypothetical protein M413DRAFT_13522 [Hebeloma cylindrosporum]|uniref:Uncharacterized protein n=1 Tax=Hebeloma cylindrosporum TaxID=76867 RepID=A0A0C2Y843_HEBCY|nr:hypothetical protein M413DRAFT_13522 [Hebeloma cylindrosporum h7]